MTKKSGTGTLIIRSDPSDATVTIGDKYKMTPAIFDLRSKDLPYDIIIEKAGYDDYVHKVIITKDAKIEINATLNKTIK